MSAWSSTLAALILIYSVLVTEILVLKFCLEENT